MVCNPSYIWSFFNVWDSIGEKTLSTFLNSSWESGRVNLIFLPDLAGDVNYLIKQFPSQSVVCNPSYIWSFFNVWDSIGEKTLSTFLNSSWESGRVNLIFLPDLAGDVNYLIKQFPSQSVVCNPSYIWRFFNVWDSIGEKTLSTFLNSAWDCGRVNLIFLTDVAGYMN